MRNLIAVFLIITSLTIVTNASNFNYLSGQAAKSEMVAQSLITAMDWVDNRIYAVGEFGIIIYSDDMGESWTQSETVPFTNTLTDISCVSVDECWATGHDATILHTSDSGKPG